MRIQKRFCLQVTALFLFFTLGCSKNFLNQQDTSRISETSLFHTAQDGISLVNAIYDTFQNDDYMIKSLWYNANFQSQDFFNWGADAFFATYQVPPNFASLDVFWSRSYVGIARANSAIPIIAKMKADGILADSLANRLTGETYFLRGIFYYYLAASFGGVPLELKTVTDNGLHPRNTQDEVFTSVIADMTTAAGLLPWAQDLPSSELGRASKGAALGYLGAAQMWLKKYPEALAAFNQLLPKYSLMTNYIDIHEYSKQNNQESLFEVQYDNPAGNDVSWNRGNEVSWISSFGWPEEISNFGYNFGNPKLYTSFESGDLRKIATIIGPGDAHPSPGIQAIGGIKSYPLVIAGFNNKDPRYIGDDGKIINTVGTVSKPWKGSDNTQLRSGYYSTKQWRDPNVTGNSGSTKIFGDQNAILLRLGEVLIDKAECQLVSGDAAGAAATLQLVRNRGFGKLANAAVVVPPLTSGDMLTNILNEYRHELAGEYAVFYNLRRAGKAAQFVLTNYGVTIPQGHELLPIPQAEISTNPTLVQNPGY